MSSGGHLESQRANAYRQPMPQPHKMDVMFYDTIVNMKSHHDWIATYHFFKALIFVIFIPFDYIKINDPNDSLILAAMIVALTVSALEAIGLISFRVHVLGDNKLLLRVSEDMNHSVQQNVTGNIKKLQNCVSTTIYNSQNQTLVSSEGLTQEMKRMYTNLLETSLKETLARESLCINCFNNTTIFLGFNSIILAIVALIIGEHNKPELILLIIFIVLESFTKMIIILAILIVALLPVICCLAICCVCCCDGVRAETRLPEASKVTQQMIMQADGTCSICFQNFVVGQDVIRLKCSPKHMFHPICISGWAKIRSSCPICRANINDGRPLGAPIQRIQ